MNNPVTTVLDKPIIKGFVLGLRRLLEDDMTSVLRQYGLFADRDWLPGWEIPQGNREARRRMEAAMQPELERIEAIEANPAKARQAAARWYIRETAFTYLNRLVGLKCLEVRGLFPEVIQTRIEYGGRSLYHRDYLDAHPELLGRADDGLPEVLRAACGDVTRQVRTLFDPDADSSVVWPRYPALRQAIESINALPLDYWREDEIIGWIYQFYNAEEKEAIRKRGKPTLPIEVAVINQFFTPRWIVKFLVDNTLGRLWLEMHPDSPRVRAKCSYLVPEPSPSVEQPNEDGQSFTLDPESPINNPQAQPRRPAKHPQDLKLIDPACGTMHFGYYAFEVFTAIYQDAREQADGDRLDALDDRAIPLVILSHNLHGVDIDLRAIQLAALSLYMKARVALQQVGVSDAEAAGLPWRVNLVSADARLPHTEIRERFVKEYEDDTTLQKVWRELFTEMEDIAQVGSLLRVEERFKALLARHRPASVTLNEKGQAYLPGAEPPIRQMSLAEVGEGDGWSTHRSLEQMLTHLRRFARDALDTADVNAQLFAVEAEKTVGLLDVLMQHYDVVVMNPPYGDQQTVPLSQYLQALYQNTKIDSGMAFVEQAMDLVHMKDGYIGALTPRSFMYLSSFSRFRETLFSKGYYIPCLLELGVGVLDDATVRTAAFVVGGCLRKSTDYSLFWNLDKARDKLTQFEQSYRQLVSARLAPSVYAPRWRSFCDLPGMGFAYNLPTCVLAKFGQFGPLDRDVASAGPSAAKVADVKQGLATGNDDAFVRYFWEIRTDLNVWRGFSKGGAYSPYYSDFDLVVNWADDGYAIKTYRDEAGGLKSRPQNATFYGREGLTYPATSERGLGVHYMPSGTIISVKGSGIYPASGVDLWYLLAFLNSNLAWAFLRVFTADREHQVGMLARFPIAKAESEMRKTLSGWARDIYALKAEWDTGNETCTQFNHPWLVKMADKTGAANFNLQVALDELERKETEIDAQLREAQCHIDEAVYELYGISSEDRVIIARELGERPPELVWPQLEGKSQPEKRKEHVRRLLSYFLLQALIADQDGVVPLVEGTGETTAITRLRTALEEYFGEETALRVEDDAGRVLGKPVAVWLDSDYIKWHSALYKNRPIVWQLSSERGAFSCLLYYHRLDNDTLQKVRTVYLRPLLSVVEDRGQRATERKDLKTAAECEAIADELRVFSEKLETIIRAGYKPVIDDGVKRNILPLQEAGVLKLKKVV